MIEPEFACFFSIVPTYTSVLPFGTQKLLHIIDLPYECYPSLSSGFVIRSLKLDTFLEACGGLSQSQYSIMVLVSNTPMKSTLLKVISFQTLTRLSLHGRSLVLL